MFLEVEATQLAGDGGGRAEESGLHSEMVPHSLLAELAPVHLSNKVTPGKNPSYIYNLEVILVVSDSRSLLTSLTSPALEVTKKNTLPFLEQTPTRM